MQYPAIITKEGEFTLAEFPDCPGCQTFTRGGEGIEESASEALAGWLEANLGRDMVPNHPGAVSIRRRAQVKQISVPLVLSFRLELRWARAGAEETQAEFAKKLGMSQQQYARLEGAGSNPTLGTLDRLATLTGLGISVTKVPMGYRGLIAENARQPYAAKQKSRGGKNVKQKSVPSS